ncbi:GldG family protein [Odoribacter sp. OttesenSCG-928-J03]|nr:GldG family protein [Odoribacter sp. OttesenSCG-928-J03]MDL2283195.1 GldG family protein [Odoribacter sp. OttesenSCG-928-G04]MDL2331008.1 GldG family protein [Odoribacter sp. OttesenSCG-928-A06]
MKQLTNNYIYLILFIILLNVLSYFVFIRIDLTAHKRYSLSNVSKEVIKHINEPVTVHFYVSEELPIQSRKIAKEFMALLKEYRSLSKTHFNINIINPSDIQQKMEAEAQGIIPVIMETREIDYEKIQNIYVGAVLSIGNNKSVIPHIDHTTPIEYEITRILKQAFDTVKPKIAFATGHQEASFPLMPQLINPLSELADLHTINLNNTTDKELHQFNTLCIIAPKDSYTSYELALINKYLANGGRLFVALKHAIGQINESRNTGFINKTGLEDFLENKGLKIQNDFIIDNNCGTISVDQYNGFMHFKREIVFPYLVKITNFSDHMITKGLNYIFLPFASSIKQVKTNTTYIFTPLATTSSISGVQRAPIFFNLQKQWMVRDFNSPYSVVAAMLTNDDNNSAVIAVSNADFLINDIGLNSHTLRPDNIHFALNSIEWLGDNSGLIKLRNKFTAQSPIKALDQNKRLFLQYLNLLLPIFIISIFGAFRFQSARNRRIRRMSGGYID